MVKICIVGCLHGELDKMYEDVRKTEIKYGFKTDIVLCCGDFQSIRNESDLSVMSVPPKYRKIGDFWKYYASEKTVPYLTIFVGGNHEATNYLQELPYGGWVAPNVYFMGYAGVINFGGLRIAGVSGIYKRYDYYTGHFEHAPYDDQTKRTAYHVRSIETFRLKQIKKPIDIVISHDWPRGIHNYSDQLQKLLNEKPHFLSEIKDNTLGNPAAEEILMHLKPKYWFAAHLHCKFAAIVKHNDQIESTTKFLALDKCLPFRNYMQFIDINGSNQAVSDGHHLSLDPEWLCILRATNHLMSISRTPSIMPTGTNEERSDFSATEDDLKELSYLFNNQFKIPNNFQVTAPVHEEQEEYDQASFQSTQVPLYTNPQTDLICAMLELINPNAQFLGTSCSLSDLSKKLKMKRESDNDDDDDNGEGDSDQETGSEGEAGGESSCEENRKDGDDKPVDNGEKELETKYECSSISAELAKKTIKNSEEIEIDDSDEDEVKADESVNDIGKESAGQYDPTDYPAEENEDDDDENGYCPMAPSV